MSIRNSCNSRRAQLAASAFVALPLCFASASASAETRGYVVSWFATATYIKDFKENCPQDKNGGQTAMNTRQLMELGFTKPEAEKIIADSGAQLAEEYRFRIYTNAKVKGENVSVFSYPEATDDPNVELVTGPNAYGFDLGGRSNALKFEDPDTGQKIDNQLWRAVGCLDSFRAVPPGKPYPEELSWNLMVDSGPAWLIQITGEDLSKDGPVTITMDRATQHPERDAIGEVARNQTFIVDELNPRSHNVHKGTIKNGMLTIEPAHQYLEGEHPFYYDIELHNAHWRVRLATDGRLVGYWGGYLDWQKFNYMYTSRPANGADSIGMYHALRKMADANPDPKTGQNRWISGTYRIEATPAYLANAKGQIVATPTGQLQPVQPGRVAAN